MISIGLMCISIANFVPSLITGIRNDIIMISIVKSCFNRMTVLLEYIYLEGCKIILLRPLLNIIHGKPFKGENIMAACFTEMLVDLWRSKFLRNNILPSVLLNILLNGMMQCKRHVVCTNLNCIWLPW